MRRGRAGAGAVAFAAVAALAAGSASAQDAVRFSVSDHLSPGQVEEVITVYIGPRNVGTLHVDAAHPDDRVQVSVPRASSYEYALCGRLKLREGAAVTEREINDGGTLTDVEDRDFAAYTEGSALFYLLDVTSGQRPAEVRRDQAQHCAAAVASR